MPSSGKIEINGELCKSCGLCVEFCPKKVLRISDHYNDKGYYPAEQFCEGCTGCGMCAVVCPEAIIEVWRD
ncbi:4Fe-4S dicluster domain-containing protein [bacterium]|nr:MAG: 4Fe-4S dicluster domain-containing protein [bacterium]